MEVQEKFDLFARLEKTRDAIAGGLSGLFKGKQAVASDQDFDELEDNLIMSDIGVEASARIVEKLRTQAVKGLVNPTENLRSLLQEELVNLLRPAVSPLDLADRVASPWVVLMVGVNGAGKTTTAAKLANRFTERGMSVMLAACDTYRAAAIEQLGIWGQRLGVPVIAQDYGADAAAVAHDALNAARASSVDVLIIDSAGRQHVNTDLMEQLRKLHRVIGRIDAEAPHETLLVVDGATGQNALSQVEAFSKAVRVDGLCVTKLDGTARGGILVAVTERFSLPISFIGVGEGIDDLRVFDAEAFALAVAGSDH
tara:strand:+ start:1316 stop:2251 length:936 start_codon:yes stop_codon:yes gene_type:complete